MPFALLLALAPVAGATLLTYLYDGEALFPSRLCAGVCMGFAALGLAGFVLASWLGMTPAALALAGAAGASPLLLLLRRDLRALAGQDIAGSARAVRRAFALRGGGGGPGVFSAAGRGFLVVFL